MIASYKAANKTPKVLEDKFDIPIKYELLSSTVLRAMFDAKGIEGWKTFYEKYPGSGGIVLLSAVGFSSDGSLAMVYMGHSCGGLCGGGTTHILRKIDGKWTEAGKSSCAWAS